MWRKIMTAVAVAVVMPASVTAQSIGLSARVGTLGVGGELSLGLTNSIAVRGGIGVVPITFNGDYSDIKYEVKPTSPLANVGIDFYPGAGGLHIGGGVFLLSKPTTLDGEFSGSVQIGNRTYSDAEVGAIAGELDHGSAAPYALIGFGRHNRAGFGFFVDLGAAFMKEPKLTLTASGAATNSQEFQSNLEAERAAAEEDAKEFLKLWPILSIGIRIGVR